MKRGTKNAWIACNGWAAVQPLCSKQSRLYLAVHFGVLQGVLLCQKANSFLPCTQRPIPKRSPFTSLQIAQTWPNSKRVASFGAGNNLQQDGTFNKEMMCLSISQIWVSFTLRVQLTRTLAKKFRLSAMRFKLDFFGSLNELFVFKFSLAVPCYCWAAIQCTGSV